MKKLSFILSFFLLFVIQFSFSQNVPHMYVSALNGTSGIGMAYLFENPPVIDGKKVLFETAASPDILLPRLLKGEVDIGVLPPNVAAKVYNVSNGALVIGAVVGNGMLSLITKDAKINSLADLAGKKVVVAAQGATPEYVFRYVLEKAGLTNRVELDFSIPAAEIAPALIAGKIDYAVVPEPFSTVAVQRDNSVRRAIDIQKIWAEMHTSNDANYPMTVVVIRSEFAKKYPKEVRAFLLEYKKSIKWTYLNQKEAGELVQKHLLGLNASVAAAAIPHCALTFIEAQYAKPQIEALLSVFLQFAPESIGGKLPNEGFYFN